MQEEWLKSSQSVIGTIILGDLNVHHKNWLTHSNSVTPEGRTLFEFCSTAGFEERVGKPTRDGHLLDLVLTDLHTDVRCSVLPKLADHSTILAQVKLGIPTVVEVPRECWQWQRADWKGMREKFSEVNWDELLFLGEESLDKLTDAAVN